MAASTAMTDPVTHGLLSGREAHGAMTTTQMWTQNVVAAVIGPRSRPQQLVLGAWDTDGRLRFTGRTAPLTAAQAAIAASFLHPPAGEHPWPEEVPATAFDRFARDRGPVHLTLVEPVVVEVSADSARSGVAFRHSVRMARFRPDLDPASVRAEPA
jgi:hypothetical protein